MNDAISAAIENAERAIGSRKSIREAVQLDHRAGLALETLADDVTRLHAEMQAIRILLSGIAAKK